MARGDVKHDSSSPVRAGGRGKLLEVPIEQLRPTQMAVGMRAVTYKRKKFERRVTNKREVEDVLSRRPIPAVRGPGGELYIIDNHHFGLALWQADVKTAFARVIDDRSAMSTAAFWRHMEAKGRLYPFDEEGARVAPSRLPTWLHALRHDPYRDLAWEVREAGGFAKVAVPYAEFRWANYFRERIAPRLVRRDYDTAIEKAMHLCTDRAARHLPGFIRHHK